MAHCKGFSRRRRRILRRFMGAIWAATLLFACTALSSCATINRFNLLSTKDEVSIGRKAAQEVEKELRIYGDPVVAAYIDSLGQILARNSKRPDLEYHFKVVDTDEVNAFALPGGWLYINRGLITVAGNESELAGVIAHEIGHVVGRHGARQITKQYGLAVLMELALGGEENPSLAREIAEQFASIGAGLTLLKYSRDAEREADVFAVEEMAAAGIDPEGMVSFLAKLQAQREAEPSGTSLWFSTHPATGERIQNVRAAIQKLPPAKATVTDTRRFQTIKERLLQDRAAKARRSKS